MKREHALFETETCGRCGGSGSYSYNAFDGTRCYGCAGRGWRLSKRGKAAQAWHYQRLETPVGQINVGDQLIVDVGITSPWRRQVTVTAIEPDRYNPGRGPILRYTINATGEPGGLGCANENATFRRVPTADDRERGLAYQALLTKAGKPRKGAQLPA